MENTENRTKMDFSIYFKQMMEWKKLPAYRLEPRIDSFIGYYLKNFLNEQKINGKSLNIDKIIPEFPLKKEESNRSNKVDFLAISKSDKHYLVEFKTDVDSIDKIQLLYLFEAKTKKEGFEVLIKGLYEICNATDSFKKYKNLLEILKENNIIDKTDKDFSFKNRINKDLGIIYIIPHETGLIKKYTDEIIDEFKDKPSELNTEIEETYYFDDIITYLNQDVTKNSFEEAFINALEEWRKPK